MASANKTINGTAPSAKGRYIMRFQNKTAVITGASRGIGKAIALTLAKEGANIAVVFTGDDENAAATKQEILELGVKCETYDCDVSSFEATKQVCDAIIEEFGGIDILVNNAGIVRDKLVLRMEESDYDAVLAVNLKGGFNMIKNTYSHFMKKRCGRIISTSSVVGLNGNAGQANYAAAKAGIIGLTKSVAKELAARGVTCNAVAPGFIATDMTNALSDKVKKQIAESIPARKMGTVQDVANAVAFLASDEAAYITGEVIRVDGGMAM